MNKLNVELENCYGIKKLQSQFDFSQHFAYVIYAPNGAMKTSFAKTFKDISDDCQSQDRIFSSRVCIRNITDESGLEIPKENVFVISPYDEVFGQTEKTSTLLVDNTLRKEYEDIHVAIDESKKIFLKALKEQSGSKKDLEKEISLAFTKSDSEFYRALIRVKDEVVSQKNTPFAEVKYDTIFDEKVLSFLGTKDVKTAIESYIKKYNELLAASTYFKQGIFNYYNAATIAKTLADNGFFDAKHTINLNATEKVEIISKKQLEDLIQKEKESISQDKELRKTFADIEKLITKNVNVRGFEAYIAEHEELLPNLANIERFREEIWKSYFKVQIELYNDLIDKYQSAEERKNEIEQTANKQKTQWEAVIDIFNSRFFVPFKLIAKNRVPVMLGQEPILSLGFTFQDGTENKSIEKQSLMEVLSQGEKKSLYILNIIFEIEARKKANQETLFIIDDIADSFDYKNKYAIIQYLKDISEYSFFKQIILTHNFDFFRTIHSRFISYSHCLTALRNNEGILLEKAVGIKNIFVNDWKPNFFIDVKKKIASIPFMRNIIEYTKGGEDPGFIKLTSLLHWKDDSSIITQRDLDEIYIAVFNNGPESNSLDNGETLMIDLIEDQAQSCLGDRTSVNFENKIVLSLAIRIFAEKFMVNKINDDVFSNKISSNQTPKLLKKYKELFSNDIDQIKIIESVILMTPENIHLNSFMYEPILDMSDDHLKKLYQDVLSLR